ncbi:MAG: hypothetical protein KatS3mg092_0894 [Patescibacteria group bacterium]|nr:MAG: hypothetical protein KatS3mg092_0894 [Patescibacteria group bacterium]
MKQNYKKYLIFGGLIFVLLIISYFLIIKNTKSKTNNDSYVVPTQEVLPTVDSSTKVDLKLIKKGEALLTVTNEPKNTSTIDFELSYQVVNNDVSEGGEGTVEQGVIGKCYKQEKEWQCGESNNGGSRKIILGTCSSGTCRYHNIVGSIKILLRFTGDYGQKIFEKEYQL